MCPPVCDVQTLFSLHWWDIYIHLVYVLEVLAVLIMDVVPTLKEEWIESLAPDVIYFTRK